MKNSQYMALLAGVYIAPTLSKGYSITFGVICILMGLYEMIIGE